jgi:hypothetical protein
LGQTKFWRIVSFKQKLETLNIEKPQINVLRLQKGFPFVRLNSRNRVYLLNEVVKYLQDNARTISE